MEYRHELKFLVSDMEINILKYRLMPLMHEDRHQTDGNYNIRSLYFDDFYDTCMHENEDGTDNRKKYRIRIYNHSKEVIKLELKQKYHGKTSKYSCRISISQCEQLMQGIVPTDITKEQRVLHKLAYLMETKLMRPKVIVDYDRVPYVYRTHDANVRVTFDKNIKSIREVEAFFDPDIGGRGVLPVGQALMEVKFDAVKRNVAWNLEC